jgi:hypothetical protein
MMTSWFHGDVADMDGGNTNAISSEYQPSVVEVGLNACLFDWIPACAGMTGYLLVLVATFARKGFAGVT